MTGAGLAATALGGCGASGPTNKDQIATIVKHEGADPASVCDRLTSPLLATLGGRVGCTRRAVSAATDRTTKATSIEVRGRTATAVVLDSAGTQTVSFIKQNGVWKVTAVR